MSTTTEATPRGWLMAGKAAKAAGMSVNSLRELALQGRIARAWVTQEGKK